MLIIVEKTIVSRPDNNMYITYPNKRSDTNEREENRYCNNWFYNIFLISFNIWEHTRYLY